MKFVDFCKYQLWDFLLCVVASFSLSYIVAGGFYATLSIQASLWVLGLAAVVLTAALFAMSYSMRAAIGGGIGMFVLVVVYVIVSMRINGDINIVADYDGNLVIPLLVCLLPALLVFLLSRKKVGAIVLIVIGVMAFVTMEHLYSANHLVAFALFMIAVVALFVYKNYQKNLIGSDSDTMSLPTVAGVGALAALLAFMLSLGLFFVVVAPLNPGHVEVKLITQYVRLEEMQVKSISSEVNIMGLSHTLQTDDRVQDAMQDLQKAVEQGTNNKTAEDNPNKEEQAGASWGLDSKGDLESAEAQGLQVPTYTWVLLPLLLVALVLGIIFGRRGLRKRKWARIQSMPPRERVQAAFRYFVGSFGKMGMGKPETQTLVEYGTSSEELFSRFESAAASSDFPELIASYEAVAYGGVTPDEDDVSRFDRYYEAFHRRSRSFVGNIKYLLLFFRI